MDRHLERLRQQIALAVADLSPEQLGWHAPGKWCVAEILEHLYLSYTGTVRGFARVAAAGKPLAAIPTWKQRGKALVVVGFGHMPVGTEAPAVARPHGVPPEKVLAEIGPKIAEMDEILSRCAATFGTRVKALDHPILGPLSIAQWRKLHLVHGLHHVKQIRRLRGQSAIAAR